MRLTTRATAASIAPALVLMLVTAAGGCRDRAPGGKSGRPANAPEFASVGTAPDEGAVVPVDAKPTKPLRIAVLGLENSPFWIPVKAGVERAGRELAARGVTVEWIVGGDSHTTDFFGRAIDGAVAKQYDAIATIAGDAGVAAYIDRAVRAGIPVATFNSETDTPNQRLFFVGADSYAQGQEAGAQMCRAIGGSGKVAIITGYFAVESHQARVRGFEDGLKQRCPDAAIVGRVENQDKAELAYQQAKDFMTAHPDLRGLIATAGSPFGAARAIEEQRKMGTVHMISFDAVPETLDYIERGVIDASIGQNPDAQGHDPVIRLYNYLVAGTLPPYSKLLTRAEVINRDNASRFRVVAGAPAR